jgi:anti-sigma B factor antagonist
MDRLERNCGLEPDEPMPVRSRRVADAVVVSVFGEADIDTAPALLPAIEQCLQDAGCRVLVVDLSAVDFFASAGLKALLDVADSANDRGMPFRIVVGDNRHITRPLDLSGLAEELAVFGTVDDALCGPGGQPG